MGEERMCGTSPTKMIPSQLGLDCSCGFCNLYTYGVVLPGWPGKPNYIFGGGLAGTGRGDLIHFNLRDSSSWQ